jgi:hypothetical protein
VPVAVQYWNAYAIGARYNALRHPVQFDFGFILSTQYQNLGLDYQVSGNPNQSYGRRRQICVTTNNCTLGYYTGTLLNLAYWYDNAGNVTTLRGSLRGAQSIKLLQIPLRSAVKLVYSLIQG